MNNGTSQRQIAKAKHPSSRIKKVRVPSTDDLMDWDAGSIIFLIGELEAERDALRAIIKAGTK